MKGSVTEMWVTGGGADVGQLIRNLIFDPLRLKWQQGQKMEQGHCDGAKMNGRVLDKAPSFSMEGSSRFPLCQSLQVPPHCK